MNELVTTDNTGHNLENIHAENLTQYVTFMVNDQLFGVPVLQVQDILKPEDIAKVPLAPPEVRGSINLRGRIVTVIDVRVRLGLPRVEDDERTMGVTVEQNSDLYTLMVDSIGEVLSLPDEGLENVPGTIDSRWRDFADGVYQLDEKLMVVLDVDRLLSSSEAN